MNRNRLLIMGAAAFLTVTSAFVSCRKEAPAASWLGGIHAEGRSLFYATVRDGLPTIPGNPP